MENASKALIIAGAILISILLISVGIMVFNSVSQPIAEAGEQGKSQAAQMFNEPFIQYEGKQTYANARSLVNKVNASNASSDRKVNLIGKDAVTNRSYVYTVKIDSYDTEGYVMTMTITGAPPSAATP